MQGPAVSTVEVRELGSLYSQLEATIQVEQVGEGPTCTLTLGAGEGAVSKGQRRAGQMRGSTEMVTHSQQTARNTYLCEAGLALLGEKGSGGVSELRVYSESVCSFFFLGIS